MHGSGLGGFGAPPSFPAPGTPNTNPAASPATPSSTTPPSVTGPAGTPPVNPFNLFGGFHPPAAGAPAGSPGSTHPPFNPALMQQMLGGGGFGGLGGFGGAPPPPADTRSPEERFQTQLQQLQEMGFTNAAQNVRALLATGGNVQAAVEYIFGGGGL